MHANSYKLIDLMDDKAKQTALLVIIVIVVIIILLE